MFYLTPDTIPDSLSFYLKAAEPVARPDPLSVDFGRFEYLPLQDNHLLFAIDSTYLESLPAMMPTNAGVSMPLPGWVESIVFLLFVLCFVLFSFVYRGARGSFWRNFKNKLFIREKPLSGYKVQVTTAEVWGEFFMIGQTVVMTSIVLLYYFLYDDLVAFSPWFPLVVLAAIVLGLALLGTLKYVMYRAIATFFLPGDLTRWIGQYYQHAQLLGIFLFLPVLVFVFLQEYRNITFLVILFLFFINRLLVILSLLNIFVKNKVGIIYFFVYLCGTEIAPYLLFYKGVVSIVTIAGNYLV